MRFKTQDVPMGSWAHRLIGLLLCLALIAWINPQADRTKAGNRSYNKELYDEAMTKYTEALIDLPNSPYLHLNIGNAAYKKENYEEAIKSYTKTASLAADATLESKAYYNLGNCKYRQGKLKENTNLGETILLLREALEYYKQALNKNPKDTNAKYNHEFVERKIKELLDKQQQQQEQSQEQQNQQDQENQSEKDNEEQSEDKEQNAAPAEAQESQEKSEPEEKLTEEEAKMLLDSLKDEELSQLKRSRDRRLLPRVLKDW